MEAPTFVTRLWSSMRREFQNRLSTLDPRVIVDAIPHIVWSATPNGVTDYVNQKWIDFSGSEDPSQWLEYIHPEDRLSILRTLRDAMYHKETFEAEHRIGRPGGPYRWVLGRVQPLLDAQGRVTRWIGTSTDIDDAKSTQERLQKSELLYQLATRATKNIIWDYDISLNKVRWNEALVSELGHAPEFRISSPEWWMEHIHPEDRGRVFQKVQDAQQNAVETLEGEYRFRCGDGAYRCFIDRAIIVRNARGELIRVVGAMEDVTPTRSAIAQLRESEQRWRTLTNSMSQIAWMADPKDYISWFNDRWYEFTGLDAEASLRLGWREVVHPAHLERVMNTMLNAFASGNSWEDTFPIRGRDGEYRWFLSTAHPITCEGGTISHWLGTNTDITKQLQLTEQIREREEHLRIATEAAKLGTWNLDLVSWEGQWNKRCAEVFGCPDQLLFSLRDLLERVHPDDASTLRCYFEQVHDHDPKAEDNGYQEIEIRILRPDGEQRWVAIAAKHLEKFNPRHGQRLSMVGTIMDLTDRINAQEELKAAKNAAESANAAKSAFLANMSHEIRTPLGAILGFTNLLRNERYTAEQRNGFIETIARAGTSLTSVIDDVLDLSKIEAGRIELEEVSFSIHEMLNECAALFSVKAKSKGIDLSFVVQPETPAHICSDPTRIRQILLNLIGNAVKFTSVGSVIVFLESQVMGDDRVAIQIHVKDTGIGLSEDQRSRIFQPFTQADNSTTRTHGGTGLGLTLSRRLALALGGDIICGPSAQNAGCTFSLILEASIPPSAEIPEALVESPLFDVDLNGMSLLVAEDSPEIQFLLDNILSSAGALVEVVSNGQEAIARTRCKAYDAILMDIQMPLVDGYEATKSIRSLGYRGTIIALTAHAMSEERQRTRSAGCDYHLTKPIRPGELLGTLARCYLS